MLKESHPTPAVPAPKAVAVRRTAPSKVAVAAAPVPQAPASTTCIEVIRGTVKSTECF